MLAPSGCDGAIRVRFLGEHLEHLVDARDVALAATPEAREVRVFRVVDAQARSRSEVRMTLDGLESAADLHGWTVLGREAELTPLPPGEFYCYQLVGCEVFAQDGERIGAVKRVWETGAHDVLVVEDARGREVLLPAAEDLLRELDVERGKIVIEVIPGLLDPV